MQCALVAMMASGYRPSTSAPGHHQTMIQSLPLTLGLDNDTWIVLDALRKKRNLNDYTGAPSRNPRLPRRSSRRTGCWRERCRTCMRTVRIC